MSDDDLLRLVRDGARALGLQLIEPPDDGAASTWRPVDLTPALTGIGVPAPELWERTDGLRMLYRGRLHWFYGPAESCKSWAALEAGRVVLEAGGRVLWIDFEDDENGIVDRLKALCVSGDVIHERFTYLRPDEPLATRDGRFTAGNTDLAELLERAPFDLAVIDGVTEAMVTESLDLRDNADVARWIRRLPKRLSATGAAVICIDHVPKSSDDDGGRSRFAIGGQHKLAGLSGASYRFDTARTFARALGAEETVGRVRLEITKDRPGHIRPRCTDDHAGILELTSWPDGGVSIALDPADAAGGRDDEPDPGLCRKILGYVAQYPGASRRNICEGVKARDERIREAVTWMVLRPEPWLAAEPKGNGFRHSLTAAGTAEIE